MTVNAANATVNNYATVTGDLIIKDVSANTWNEYANMNKIVFNAEGKTLNLRSGVGSLAINVNSNLITRRQLKGVRLGAGVVVKVKATIGSTKSTTVTGSGGQETITPPAVPVKIKYVMATDADFSGTADGSFKYTGTAEYVEIPHEIKEVPVTSYTGMFSGTDVKGVKSDNKNIVDMGGMFYNSQATTLDLSSFDTSSVTNMENMFFASKASSLDLSSFDTSSVTNMKNMFAISKASTLELSSFDTSSVTDMSSMFAISQASSLDLSKFNTSKVTNMGNMFGNSQASTLDLSKFDTSKVTNMGSMFEVSQATTLDLSSFDTSSVTNMEDMFFASKASTLDLSSFDTSGVTEMFRMFYDSIATIGYAKTQADAEKFNASSNKPDGLTFTVKP